MEIINYRNLSPDEIYVDEKAYIDAHPNPEKWTDFSEATGGRLIMELVAGVGSYLSFHLITLKTEQFLFYCRDIKSARACAEVLGYSAFRGRNLRVKITFTPSIPGSVTKFMVVGKFNVQDLVCLDDVAYLPGQQVTIECVVGNLREETIPINTDQMGRFPFYDDLVSEDFRLYVNGLLVPDMLIGNQFREMLEGKFVCITNTHGALSVYSLNDNDPYVYTFNDTMTLQYVQYSETEYSRAEITFNYGTLDNVEFSSPYVPEETIEQIRINAPISHETQNLIRGRDDYMKLFLLYGLPYGIVDTNYIDDTPAYVILSYVRNNDTLLTDSEKGELIYKLDTEAGRPLGIPSPTIQDPVRVSRKINIELTIFSNYDTSNVYNDINQIVAKYSKKLGITLNMEDIESDLEDLVYVKVARVTLFYPIWVSDTSYEVGDIVSPGYYNGYSYIARQAGTSGASRPNWSTIAGTTFYDGAVLWETIAESSTTSIPQEWNEYFNLEYNLLSMKIA